MITTRSEVCTCTYMEEVPDNLWSDATLIDGTTLSALCTCLSLGRSAYIYSLAPIFKVSPIAEESLMSIVKYISDHSCLIKT
jgi:hypothetical protein